MLDLRAMKALDIDSGGRTAWAETGLTAGEYTNAAGAQGLATGFGDTGSVGIVAAIFPAVPFMHGHGLSVGALSYRGRLHLGLYADAEVVPDVRDLARDLEAAFDALRLPPAPRDTPWRARAQRRRRATRRA